ncbi:MAG TPA: tetratricopeptide repeat protein [Micromonosporaceae bacterium]|nr:tetratricopeptide repeat protein [Micromonosporaceae bacterium]
MIDTPPPMPEHAALVTELRIVREHGLLHLRGVPLDALRGCAARCGLGDDAAAAGPVEMLVRAAVDNLGGGRLSEAAEYTFGLAPGTRDWPAQDRRRRAAQAYAVSVERFRKHHERVILEQVAEQALTLAQRSTPRSTATRASGTSRLQPQPHDGPVGGGRGEAILGLPRDTAYFAGRSAELDAAVAALRSHEMRSETAVICVIDGMAGVGKTALAVRVARQVSDEFPDGCLFLDLHGYTTGVPPVPAAEALDRMLRRLGVAGNQIPRHLDDRAALYRDRLSGRRFLILLDNARDAAQVRPLLPAAPGCGILITSRDQLVALDEAQTTSLDPLPHDDAAALFRSVVGTQRIGRDNQTAAIHLVVDLCGRLPLAIRIAAARHRANRRQTLTDLANRLADKHAVLAELDDGDRSVAASFAVSYNDLPDPGRRMFTVLALHPGEDFDAYAAAALSGQPVPQSVRLLDHLVERHLLSQHTRDRYRFHDLIGTFADHHTVPQLTEQDRDNARRRLIDYYLCVAEQADTAITPHRYRIPLDIIHRPSAAPYVGKYDDALAWLTAEEPNIVSACQAAAQHFETSCWQLAVTMRGFFFLTKRWDPWLTTHELALASTRRLGDRRAEAMTLNNIGLAAIEQGQYDVAATHYEQALELFRQVGDAHGEHTALANHAWISFFQGDHDAFLRDSQPALEFYRSSGAHRNAAITLRGIALAEVELGRLAEATEHLHQALNTFRKLDLRLDATMTLNGLGEAYQRAGDLQRAVEFHQQALESSKLVGSDFEHARADHRLGQLAAHAGDQDRAREHWNRALELYQTLGAPQAIELRDCLASLPRATPQQR